MRQSAIILSVVLTAQLSAAVYYVSPAGKNKNPGTEAKPFKTIAFAAKKAMAWLFNAAGVLGRQLRI